MYVLIAVLWCALRHLVRIFIRRFAEGRRGKLPLSRSSEGFLRGRLSDSPIVADASSSEMGATVLVLAFCAATI